jgi:hypothetical protein
MRFCIQEGRDQQAGLTGFVQVVEQYDVGETVQVTQPLSVLWEDLDGTRSAEPTSRLDWHLRQVGEGGMNYANLGELNFHTHKPRKRA